MTPASETEILRVIAAHMPEVAWAAAAEDRRTLFVSEAASSHYGLPPSHFVGHGIERFRDLIHPDDLETFDRAVAAQGEGSLEHELRMVLPSGDVRWTLTRSYPVRDDDGSVVMVVGTSVDITAQKETERRFRDLVEQLPVTTYLTRRESGLPPVYVNPQVEELTGFTPDEWIHDRPYMTLVDPRDLDLVEQTNHRLCETDEPARVSYRLRHRDGRTIWVRDEAVAVRDANGELTLVQGFLLDITDTVTMTEELRDREEQGRAFISTAWDAFTTHAGGVITNVEGRLPEMLGRDVDEIIGAPVLEFAAEGERERLVDRLRSGETSVMEVNLVHADGSLVPVEIVSRDVEIAGLVARQVAIRDIGPRKRAEAALAEAENRARHAQKLEAVGRLAGGIAHDFNNLLMAITGYADIIVQSLPSDSPLRDDATEIRNTAGRGAELTRQLLAFSRRQVMEQQVLSLSVVVRDSAAFLQRLVGEDVTIVTKLDPSTPPVLGNRSELDQVLANLVVNARDAMPAGGSVTIETRPLKVTAAFGERHPPGSYAVLVVSDDGTGMDEETRAQIFEPYFTTKEAGKGTGLGLATVYGIVTQFDGTIDVVTARGEGTSFVITFTASDEPLTLDATSAPPHELRGGEGERVLLVEDQESVRRMLSRLVSGLGYSVDVASSGAEALELLSADTPYALLITDVLMPNMGGPELVTRARVDRPELPVLYVSGYTTDELLAPGGLPPRASFLAKPFTRAALAAEINSVVGK